MVEHNILDVWKLLDEFTKAEFCENNIRTIQLELNNWKAKFNPYLKKAKSLDGLFDDRKKNGIKGKSITSKGCPPGKPFNKNGEIFTNWTIEMYEQYMKSLESKSTCGNNLLESKALLKKKNVTPKGIPPGAPFDKDGVKILNWKFSGWILPSLLSNKISEVTPKGISPGAPFDKNGNKLVGWIFKEWDTTTTINSSKTQHQENQGVTLEPAQIRTTKGIPPGPPFTKRGELIKKWTFKGWNNNMTPNNTISSENSSSSVPSYKTPKGIPPGPPFNKNGELTGGPNWKFQFWKLSGRSSPLCSHVPGFVGSNPSAVSKTPKGIAPGPPPPRTRCDSDTKVLQQFNDESIYEHPSWKGKGRPPGKPPMRKNRPSSTMVYIQPEYPQRGPKGTLKGIPPGTCPPLKNGRIRVKKMPVQVASCPVNGKSNILSDLKATGGKAGMSKKSIKVKAPAPIRGSIPPPPKGWQAKSIQWSVITDKRLKKNTFWLFPREDRIDPVVAPAAKPANFLEELKLKNASGTNLMKPALKKAAPPSFKWNFNELTLLFFEDPAVKKKREEEKRLKELEKKENNKSKQVKRLMDPQKSQNLEIGLRGSGLLQDEAPLWRTVNQLQFEAITPEEPPIDAEVLGVLMGLMPTGEDLKALITHMNDCKIDPVKAEERLAIGEMFVLKCLGIHMFTERATCCLIKLKYEDQIRHIEAKADILSRCVTNIIDGFRPDGILTVVFRALLDFGNYINYGTKRGNAKGIPLKSFECFRQIKTLTGGLTIYRYLIGQLAIQLGPHVYKEVEDALALTIPSLSVGEVSEVSGSLEEINDRVKKIEKVMAHPELSKDVTFTNVFEGFVNGANEEINKIREQLNEVTKQLSNLLEITNEKGSSAKDGLEVIRLLMAIWRDIKHAIDENRLSTKKEAEKLEREKKREAREREKQERERKKEAEKEEKAKRAQERINRRDKREEEMRKDQILPQQGENGTTTEFSPLPTSRFPLQSPKGNETHRFPTARLPLQSPRGNEGMLPTSRKHYKEPLTARRLQGLQQQGQDRTNSTPVEQIEPTKIPRLPLESLLRPMAFNNRNNDQNEGWSPLRSHRNVPSSTPRAPSNNDSKHTSGPTNMPVTPRTRLPTTSLLSPRATANWDPLPSTRRHRPTLPLTSRAGGHQPPVPPVGDLPLRLPIRNDTTKDVAVPITTGLRSSRASNNGGGTNGIDSRGLMYSPPKDGSNSTSVISTRKQRKSGTNKGKRDEFLNMKDKVFLSIHSSDVDFMRR